MSREGPHALLKRVRENILCAPRRPGQASRTPLIPQTPQTLYGLSCPGSIQEVLHLARSASDGRIKLEEASDGMPGPHPETQAIFQEDGSGAVTGVRLLNSGNAFPGMTMSSQGP